MSSLVIYAFVLLLTLEADCLLNILNLKLESKLAYESKTTSKIP